MRRERRMIITGILICGTFCLGWLPGAIQVGIIQTDVYRVRKHLRKQSLQNMTIYIL